MATWPPRSSPEIPERNQTCKTIALPYPVRDGLPLWQIPKAFRIPAPKAIIMSFEATHWASQARGITPSQKLILFFLADFHTPDFGCEVALSELAEETEIPIFDLEQNLSDLEHRGWLRLAADGRIWLNFEDGFEALDERGVAT